MAANKSTRHNRKVWIVWINFPFQHGMYAIKNQFQEGLSGGIRFLRRGSSGSGRELDGLFPSAFAKGLDGPAIL